MDLRVKIAVVTGSASALGRATCDELKAAGAIVFGFERDEGGLQSLRADFRQRASKPGKRTTRN